MAITDSQKVDILYKKLSGVSKTDTGTAKSPANEANASPQLSPGSTVWQQDYYIPNVTTLPASNSSVVTVYRDSVTSTVQAVSLAESAANETWATNLTNWISPQFGAGYQVKLYAAPSGTSNPQTTGINLPVGGSGNADSWYFDYIAGIVNFADTNVPSAVAGNVVYVVGARYTGVTGINNFANLTIGNILIAGNTISGNGSITVNGNISATGNISTTGNISAGNISANLYGTVQTANQPLISNIGTLGNLTVTGNVSAGYLIGNAAYLTSIPVTNTYSNANVAAYLLTNTGNIAAGNLSVTGNITLGNVVLAGGTYGNVFADTITPYQTTVTVFNSNTAVGLPAGTSTQYPTANVAGYFRYNISVSTVEFYNGSNWIPFTNTISDQQITPNGTSASFTLNQATSAEGILVSINGTVQRPGTAYSVSGTTITFSEVPNINDIIDVRFIASATSVILTGLTGDISTTGNITGNVIQANTLSVSSLTANLTGNVVGNLTGNVRADTVYANTVIVSSSNITVGTTSTIIDSFNSSVYRSAKYVISSTTPYDSQYAEVALTQFGSTVVTTAYALLNTGANTVTFTANVNGSTVNLLAQGTISANQLRIQRTYFNV